MELDRTDCKLLNLLQEDNRKPFTQLADDLGISNYEVKKRYEDLLDNNIFYPRIQIRLRQLGFDQIFNVRVSLSKFTEQEYEDFLSYLRSNAFVSEIFSTSGEWDVMLVIISVNGQHYESVKKQIRDKHASIIDRWEETLTPRTYKFEEFDMEPLLEALEEYQD